MLTTQNTDLPRRFLAHWETCAHSSIACQTLSRLSASYSFAPMCRGISKQPNGYGFSRPLSDPRKPQRLTTKAAFEPIRNFRPSVHHHRTRFSFQSPLRPGDIERCRPSSIENAFAASIQAAAPFNMLEALTQCAFADLSRQGIPFKSIPMRVHFPFASDRLSSKKTLILKAQLSMEYRHMVLPAKIQMVAAADLPELLAPCALLL